MDSMCKDYFSHYTSVFIRYNYSREYTATRYLKRYATIPSCTNTRPFCCPVEPFDHHVAMAQDLPSVINLHRTQIIF